jgi:hypothetical protein
MWGEKWGHKTGTRNRETGTGKRGQETGDKTERFLLFLYAVGPHPSLPFLSLTTPWVAGAPSFPAFSVPHHAVGAPLFAESAPLFFALGAKGGLTMTLHA